MSHRTVGVAGSSEDSFECADEPESMERPRLVYDVAVAVDWEYDADFVTFLEQSCTRRGLSLYQIRPANLNETIVKLASGEIEFRLYYDRASDTSPDYKVLYSFFDDHKVRVFENPEALVRAADKALMHYAFIDAGLLTPYTLILAPFESSEKLGLDEEDLDRVGRPFVVKPATMTGGGTGMVRNVNTLAEVAEIRKTYPRDRYLVQATVYPMIRDEKRFWFRGFYCCTQREVTWWNEFTHLYQSLSPQEIDFHFIGTIVDILEKIHHISGLHFFSTEIAVTEKGECIAVDYVNEMCDMRLKSRHPDGVPDELVGRFAEALAFHMGRIIGEESERQRS